MKITPNHTIKDNGQVFQPDTEYEVDRDTGVLYVRNGWATSPEYKWPPTEQTPAVHDLQPHSTRHTLTSTEG